MKKNSTSLEIAATKLIDDYLKMTSKEMAPSELYEYKRVILNESRRLKNKNSLLARILIDLSIDEAIKRDYMSMLATFVETELYIISENFIKSHLLMVSMVVDFDESEQIELNLKIPEATRLKLEKHLNNAGLTEQNQTIKVGSHFMHRPETDRYMEICRMHADINNKSSNPLYPSTPLHLTGNSREVLYIPIILSEVMPKESYSQNDVISSKIDIYIGAEENYEKSEYFESIKRCFSETLGREFLHKKPIIISEPHYYFDAIQYAQENISRLRIVDIISTLSSNGDKDGFIKIEPYTKSGKSFMKICFDKYSDGDFSNILVKDFPCVHSNDIEIEAEILYHQFSESGYSVFPLKKRV